MNLKKLYCGAVCAFLFSALWAAPGEINVPLRTVDGKPGCILNSDVPFQDDFYKLGSNAPSELKTRWKILHDNTNLYIGVEAFEPNPEKMTRLPQNYRNDSRRAYCADSIELNIMPAATQDAAYKTIITADGFIDDLACIDDNTGTESYIDDYAWYSHTRIISKNIGKDRWSIEAALPLGAFCDGEKALHPDLKLILGRTSLKDGKLQFAANAVTPREYFISPRAFRPLKLEGLNSKAWHYELNVPLFKCSNENGKLTVEVTNTVVNRTDKRAIVRAVTTLTDRQGQTFSVARANTTNPGQISKTVGRIVLPADGKYVARVDITDGRYRLLAERVMNVNLAYRPVSIKVLEPSYRQNIYATQDIPEIKAQILLEEGIGKPLTVTLQGGNIKLTRNIAAAQKINYITFPAADLPIGDYTLSAGKTQTVIRKLPPSKGEVWFDKNKITYVDGKPFMVYGYYGITPQIGKDFKGIRVFQCYGYKYRNPQEIIKYLDRAHAAGLKIIMTPYQEYTYSWTLKTFAFKERQRTTLTAEQRKLLVNFAKLVQKHPAFLAYYAADEPEGWGSSPEWHRAVRECLAEADPYHPVVMLNYGTDGMRNYHEGGDILMPDCYPSYFIDGTAARDRRCTYEFARLAIELSHSCWLVPQAFDFARVSPNGTPGCSPTFEDMRQQNFLAFLGNAKGIIPYSWCYRSQSSIPMRVSLYEIGSEIIALQSLLLQPTEKAPVTTSRSAKELIVGVKRFGGQMAVIAVNLSGQSYQATIKVPGTLPSKMAVSGEKRSVQTSQNTITDNFKPHETHIYLSAGVPADSIDLNAIRSEIVRQEKLRRKPGNLLAAGELTYAQQLRYAEGKLPEGVPHITASSHIFQKPYSCYGPYWLQDGIIEAVPRDPMMFFAPRADDKAPWLEVDFGKTVTVGRVEMYSLLHKNRSALNAFSIYNADNGKLLTKVTGNTAFQATAKFQPVKLRKLKVTFDKIDRSLPRRLLTEMEVYAK